MLKGNAPSARIREDPAPFALLMLTRKLMLEPKVALNSRIVVVGASDTGISFLESILFRCVQGTRGRSDCDPRRSHLRLNNVTLVSPHGLPGAGDDAAQRGFTTNSLAYSAKDRQKMALHTWSAR